VLAIHLQTVKACKQSLHKKTQSRVSNRYTKCCSVLAIPREYVQSRWKSLCRVYLFEG